MQEEDGQGQRAVSNDKGTPVPAKSTGVVSTISQPPSVLQVPKQRVREDGASSKRSQIAKDSNSSGALDELATGQVRDAKALQADQSKPARSSPDLPKPGVLHVADMTHCHQKQTEHGEQLYCSQPAHITARPFSAS